MIWQLLLAGVSALPSPMLIIGSWTGVTFGGDAGSGRLTLCIAREATIRPAFGIFDAVMSRGTMGPAFADSVVLKAMAGSAITEAIAVIEIIFMSGSPLTWMPTLNMEIDDRESDYKDLCSKTRTNEDPKG